MDSEQVIRPYLVTAHGDHRDMGSVTVLSVLWPAMNILQGVH